MGDGMSSHITTAQAYDVETFAWRDRTGQWHLVKRMETRHLFYTLRMIWNHTMPASARLPGNLYSFGPTYTRKYMIDAISAIVPELAQRKDMTPDWTAQLERMKDWLRTWQLEQTTNQPMEITQ
jgi:hypothetical protein